MTQNLSTEDYYDHHKLRPPSPSQPAGILIASQPSRKPSQRRASCVPSIHHHIQHSPPSQSKQPHHHHRRSSVQRKSMKKLTAYERSQSKPETVTQQLLSQSQNVSSSNLRKSCSSTNLNVPQQFNTLRPSSASSQTTVSCHSNVPSSLNSSSLKINRSSSLVDQPAIDRHQTFYRDPIGIHSSRDRCDFDYGSNININSDDSNTNNNNNNNHNNSNSNVNNSYNSSGFSKKKKNLWIEVKNIRETSQSRSEFFNVVSVTIIKDIGWLLLTIVISLFMITIGVSYISDCPVCKFIPYYLILAGIFGVINQIFNYRIHRKTSDILEDHSRDSVVLRLTFILICFIVGCGSYWVFKMYPPNYDLNSGDEYCNKFVYLFAFWITIMIYVIVLLVPFVWYIVGAIKKSCNKKEKIIGSTMVSLTIDGGRINIQNAV